jgi:hypothetical protein
MLNHFVLFIGPLLLKEGQEGLMQGFFLCEATEIIGDLDNFSEECTELNHLQWINLSDVNRLDLPFITKVVLKEVSEILSSGRNPKGVPYYNNEVADTKFTFLNI